MENNNIEKENMIIVSVTIRPKHKKYLEENPDINFSGLVRGCLQKHMEQRQKQKEEPTIIETMEKQQEEIKQETTDETKK